MGLFEGISKFALLSGILTAVGLLVHLIGYGAPNWYEVGSFHSGIWKSCAGSKCADFVGSGSTTGWFIEAVEALETLAFLVILGALIVIGLKLTVMKEKKILPIVIFILQFASVGLIVLGVVIYCMEGPTSNYGYAFFMVIIASVIMLVAGVTSVIDWRCT
ncbi:epithelial membrane protein 2-like [Mytilus edulis]|uniref:Uncharacterized protein n=1 Tax=Mytilus galloprovincialis TaxID=29158 RepID=A0A8B6CNX9_MYTGA|nr:Hypothetical predicted protein [Mytilus galloprovincialis]